MGFNLVWTHCCWLYAASMPCNLKLNRCLLWCMSHLMRWHSVNGLPGEMVSVGKPVVGIVVLVGSFDCSLGLYECYAVKSVMPHVPSNQRPVTILLRRYKYLYCTSNSQFVILTNEDLTVLMLCRPGVQLGSYPMRMFGFDLEARLLPPAGCSCKSPRTVTTPADKITHVPQDDDKGWNAPLEGLI